MVIIIAALLFVSALYFLNDERERYIYINDCKFKVETVDDSQERFLGLGKRENMCENCGMLFEFSQAGEYSFCMRDMKFPLDFIWILDYNVISVIENVPCNFKGNINPRVSADKVLELNAGMAEKCGIKKGDKIKYKKGD